MYLKFQFTKSKKYTIYSAQNYYDLYKMLMYIIVIKWEQPL